ncbi:MAG TPA: tRNA (guanine-N1)-methyltransferase [Cryomorphaceae bacterium]|nr:tRNA (guanine-N1)-methyltransferase [Owenweeksia sp.]HAD96622.1 tRNA (guanine-N1)-methyltransferase [Cryomorphaceae bacterium]HBF18450.1 tRNA (guanine-N1)-methyltransferase [Cryomorphaceae bacterium]|tara:strand:- start:211 stop:807 length:597 start_codon:yes stop_codon:yes gene_type:complete
MRKHLLFVLFTFLLGNLSSYAQSSPEFLDSGDLATQFRQLIDQSNDYQEYKVVKKTWINTMQTHISDSLTRQKEALATANRTIADQLATIETLNTQLSTTQDSLLQVREEKNSMALLGVSTEKSTYRIIMWGLVGLLAMLVIVFLVRFRSSNAVSSQAKQTLEGVEEEFAQYKKRSLEREQKLRRQLQDEINKQRGIQ